MALLLVLAGFETDLGLITKLGRPAVLVALGSMLVPAGAGSIVGWLIPGEFLGPEATRSTFLLFVALAVSVSALAVVAKILSDLGLMRRDFGQITVAVGMANDVVGWVLLGVLTSVVAAGGVSATDILISVGGLLLFLVLALTVGQWLVDRWLRRTRRSSDTLGCGGHGGGGHDAGLRRGHSGPGGGGGRGCVRGRCGAAPLPLRGRAAGALPRAADVLVSLPRCSSPPPACR